MNKYRAEEYINKVMDGRQIVCTLTKGAVNRHVKDLKRIGNPDFPYYFDPKGAKAAIIFVQELKHTKGEWADTRKHKNINLILEPWQHFIFWCLFGWRKLNGFRRFNKAYISCARKNGKTVKAAATANFCFFVDDPPEIGAEIYMIATKRDQARIAWAEAERQIRSNQFLKEKVKTYRQTSTVMIPGTPAMMRPLGKDSDTEDGLSPHMVVVDEYHAHRDNSQVEVMQAGMGAREQPLLYIITTAGFDLDCACYTEENALAIQILEGTLDPVPENYFCIIYTLDIEDDWTDPNVWIKANPNLGVSISRQYIQDRVAEALVSPPKRNKIMTKNLNIWTQAETRWILPEVWDACGFSVDAEALIGRDCYVGMDLGATQDLTALALCFPPLDSTGKYEFLYHFFLPEENIKEKERKDHVPYSFWAEKGLLILTPGNTTDYDFVEDIIREDAKKYNIKQIAHDPWKAHEIVNHLQNEDFEMIEVRQNYHGMAIGTDTFEKKVLAKEIAHGNHQIMIWNIGCTEVKSDRQGSICPMKPERNRSGKRIDGTIASILALGRATLNEDKESTYETHGVISI